MNSQLSRLLLYNSLCNFPLQTVTFPEEKRSGCGMLSSSFETEVYPCSDRPGLSVKRTYFDAMVACIL